jgi:hypothetical protein
MDEARRQRGRKPLLPPPAESHGAQDSSGNRAAFLLDTFLWPRKDKVSRPWVREPTFKKVIA